MTGWGGGVWGGSLPDVGRGPCSLWRFLFVRRGGSAPGCLRGGRDLLWNVRLRCGPDSKVNFVRFLLWQFSAEVAAIFVRDGRWGSRILLNRSAESRNYSPMIASLLLPCVSWLVLAVNLVAQNTSVLVQV